MSLWMIALLVALIALLTWGITATWMTWHYLSWIRQRRQFYVEHGNRRRIR